MTVSKVNVAASLVTKGGIAPTVSIDNGCRGDCVKGQCGCFPGYKGWDCSDCKYRQRLPR